MADHIQIGDVTPRIQYTADGIQTTFTYPFPIFEDIDIRVYEGLILKTLTTDFTVSGTGNSSGGNVIFGTAPSVNSIITLRRNLIIERTSDFQEAGEFRAKVINDELDKIIAMAQQLEDTTDRTLKLSDTETTIDLSLPEKSVRSNKVLSFNSDGVPVASSSTLVDIENGAADASISAAAALVSELAAAADLVLTNADVVSAQTSETNAAASATTAALAASSNWASIIQNKSDLDSPVAPVLLDSGTIFVCDTTSGAITINLPSVATVGEGYRIGIINGSGLNDVTINRNGTDTIVGLTAFTITDDTQYIGLAADDATPDNWIIIAQSAVQAGNGLTKTGSTLSLSGGVQIDSDGNLSAHGTEFNTQTGTTYQLVAADNGKVVELNNAAAVTVTLPQTSTLALAKGFQCTLVQIGAGQVTVAKEGTDTIKSKDALLALTGQYSAAYVTKRTAGSPNDWFLAGDLA